MKISILGGGNVGGALGLSWILKGHDVFFGVRNPASDEMAAVLEKGGGRARAGSAEEAVHFSDVVVNALPWAAVKDVLSGLDLSGKILLDCANPFLRDLGGLEIGMSTSAGEKVAEWAKGARVVKIFNTTGYNNMEDPIYNGEPVTMFYCSDDSEAKSIAAGLARDTGFDPVDAGPLSNARLLEPMSLLWVWLAMKGGMGRNFAFTLAKR